MKARFMRYTWPMVVFFCLQSQASEIPSDQLPSRASDPLESMVVELLAQIKAIASVLQGVEDEESARDAVNSVQVHTDGLKTVRLKLQSTPAEEQGRFEEAFAKYDVEFETSSQALDRELMRIKRQTLLYQPLKAALDDLERLIPQTPSPGRDFEPDAGFVLVDQRDPAFTVFTGVPKDIDENKLKEIRSKISDQDKVSMLTWDGFTASIDQYARSVIVIDDYPDWRAVDGLICLVGRAPGAPWGLTWNGGIAFTANDYEYASSGFASYRANPGAYRPERDPRADPIHPGGHLPVFGCLF